MVATTQIGSCTRSRDKMGKAWDAYRIAIMLRSVIGAPHLMPRNTNAASTCTTAAFGDALPSGSDSFLNSATVLARCRIDARGAERSIVVELRLLLVAVGREARSAMLSLVSGASRAASG